jgi:hypothetical protein
MPAVLSRRSQPDGRNLLELRRKKWLQRVEKVLRQAETWAVAEDWSVARQAKIVEEPPLAPYEAPVLRIRSPQGEVRVDPIGSQITGADGRVDLQAWPSLNRVRLVWHGNAMEIITDSNVPLRQPWNRRTFVQLVDDLLMP